MSGTAPQSEAATARSFQLVLACFFLSGLAALIYQTAWTRQFAFVFGTSELAVATVLAAYMGGLAAGAAVAARAAPRIRRPVLVYAILELAIALSALAVPLGIRAARALHVSFFAASGAPPGEGGFASALFYLSCSFAILLVPTSLMGATLPLLARHAVRRSSEIGSRIATLYAVNTLGAVCGTVLAGFVLLPAMGLSATIWIAVAGNGLVFAIAARLGRSLPAHAEVEGTHTVTGEDDQGGFANGQWVLPMIAVSGTVSFSYEVMWSRLLGQVLGGSVYAFATMLASFLVGIALGAAAAGRFTATKEQAARAFGWAQIGVATLSIAAFYGLDSLPGLVSSIGRSGGQRLLADAVAAALVLLPSTLAIGATFPLAVRILARSRADASTASARVYAWNTTGAIIGAIGAGFFVIPALGFANTLTLGVAASLGIALACAFLFQNSRGLVGVAGAIGLMLLAFLRPDPPWDLLRTSPFSLKPAPGRIVYYAVGRSATVMMREEHGGWKISTNGLPESVIHPPGGRGSQYPLTQWLGTLPSMLRPEANDMLVIGLGGGVLLEWIPSRIERVDVVELEPEVVAANRSIGPLRRTDPLADPRVHMIVNDARGALALTDERYDAIVSQPSHPWTAGASHLYTREFFELSRRHLTDDGVLVQWMGLPFVDGALLKTLIATLLEVFPHVQVYQPARAGAIFVASMTPLDPVRSLPLALEGRRREFAALGVYGPEDVLASLALDTEGARSFSAGAPANTDDRNLLQMRSPRILRNDLRPLDTSLLFAPYDPLRDTPEGIDRLYLTRRVLANGAPARARRLAQSTRDPVLRAIASGLVAAQKGDYRGGAELLQRGFLRDPSQREARLKLLRIQRQLQADQVSSFSLAQGELAAATSLILQGWELELQEDWEGMQALDRRLKGVWSHDPAFEDAVRLRVAWRLQTGSASRGREAIAILDGMLPIAGTLSDLLLHAKASALAGYPAGALNTLFSIGQQLKPGPRFAKIAREALALLETLPPDLSERTQLLRLATQLKQAATQDGRSSAAAMSPRGSQPRGASRDAARRP